MTLLNTGRTINWEYMKIPVLQCTDCGQRTTAESCRNCHMILVWDKAREEGESERVEELEAIREECEQYG